jgi:hypothetical protein
MRKKNETSGGSFYQSWIACSLKKKFALYDKLAFLAPEMCFFT